MLLCVVVVYWVLLNALDSIQKQAVLQEQLNFETHLLEIQIEEQKKYSEMMVKNEEQLHRQRHDLRYQLTVIRSLSREDNAPLRQYIDELFQGIPAAPKNYCENQTVNAVVSHYAALCEEQNVEADIRITVPAQRKQMSDIELCVIFGNLLENALEACGHMTEGVKFLRLSSRLEHGVLTIAMDNSFDGQVRRRRGSSSPVSGRVRPVWASALSMLWRKRIRETHVLKRMEQFSVLRCIANCRRNISITRLVALHVTFGKKHP